MQLACHLMSSPQNPSLLRPAGALAAAAIAALVSGAFTPPARAERADRGKPMEIVSDAKQSASVDLKNKLTVISGNVVIAQGSLQIKADRVEIKEAPPGRYQATARGSTERPAQFRQKRDRIDETVEAEALRVEYDGANEKVRFVGDAKMRVVRSSGPPVRWARRSMVSARCAPRLSPISAWISSTMSVRAVASWRRPPSLVRRM